MRGTLLVAAIFGMLVGTANADNRHGVGHGPVVRDHRAPAPQGPVVRDHRGPSGPVVHDRHEGGVVVHERRGPHEHVRVSGGRYVFPGGVVRVYHRPVIREHYYNVHVRPALVVEQYDPVPGYVWMRGEWTWGGGEWVWQPGYWAAAEEPAPPPAPAVQGGASISIGGGISIH